ncbi:MAG: outer membrane lipoprotein carrier protein LolA [Syntrophales bacterium]|nr:outer membrane lipoprotein carrier protein LolA [Syntrophales bacterium]
MGFKSIIGLFLSIGILMAGAPVAADQLPPLETLVEQIQQVYDATADLKASFVQETYVRSLNKKQREEGEVAFKKPRRMLWDYRKPRIKKLYINPDKAWLYIPQERAVYVQDTERVFKSQLTVRFLSGLGRLRDDFDVAYDPDRSRDEEGNYRLRLKARGTDLGVEGLRMTVDKEGHQIVMFSFADAYGNYTTVRFRNMRTNNGLPDSLFRFHPPRGVDIYPMP